MKRLKEYSVGVITIMAIMIVGLTVVTISLYISQSRLVADVKSLDTDVRNQDSAITGRLSDTGTTNNVANDVDCNTATIGGLCDQVKQIKSEVDGIYIRTR